jgi:hypothetical protein
MRAPSATGGQKITRWTNCKFRRGLYVEQEDDVYTLLAGKDTGGALWYNNYLEWNGQPYQMKYGSNAFTFGDAVRQKFLKKIDFTLVSTFADADAVVKWGYGGFLTDTATKVVSAQQPALYNVSEFNESEYGPGLTTLRRYKTNTNGSGDLVRVGLETDIAGNSLSIQEINVQTLLGRIY